MAANPFSSLDRQNFPEFSPMFARSTSTEKGFRWSIDQLARLNPVEIETDVATLARTNGHSPEDDEDTQKASEKFFSQKTILPSPWTSSSTASAFAKSVDMPAAVTPGSWDPKTVVPRRVTFSPFPPTMAFIREDSLVESELRDSSTVDAGTQTVLTFPSDYNLESLLGPGFTCCEEDSNRDLGGSLRRKLFGQPGKLAQLKNSDSMQLGGQPSGCRNPHVQPTPQKSPHPTSYYESPAILFKRKSAVPMDSEDEGQASDPAASSLVLQTPCKDPVGLSPIDCRSEGTQPEMNETCDQEPFPVTPCKAAPSSPILSPIVRGAKAGVLPVASPMVVGKPLVGSSGKTTSTPNTAVMKRQLAASPFASPVLKQPRTKRPGQDEEDSEKDRRTRHGDSDSEEELAQPLSLADLQTETYDLTSVTSTGCTGFFTNFGLEDQPSQQPLHSTAYKWLPNSSTAVPSLGYPGPSGAFSTNWLSMPGGVTQTHSACVDSGVAASSEFNGTTATSSNELGGMKSSGSLQQSLQASGKEEEVCGQELDSKYTTGIGDVHHTPKSQTSWQLAHTKRRQPNLPTINEDEIQNRPEAGTRIPCGGATPKTVPIQADSGVMFSPEVHTDSALLQPLSMGNTPQFLGTSGTKLSPSIPKPHPTSPYQHICTSRLPQSGLVALPRTTPSRYTSAASGGVAYGSHGKFTNKSIFRNTVLPSRLKLHMSPGSLPLHFGRTNVDISTPSRYCGVRVTNGRHTGYSTFAEEVIRRKESLKAQLQFGTGSVNYPFTTTSSTYLHMRGMGLLSPEVKSSRFPVNDVGLTPPSRPLSSLHPTHFPLQAPPSPRLTNYLSPSRDETNPPSCWAASKLSPTAYVV